MLAVTNPIRPKRKRACAGGAPAPRRQAHRQLETSGLIVIAILILAITVFRYWHNIHWSTR